MIGKRFQKFVRMFIACITIFSMLAQPAYSPTTVSAEGEPYPFFLVSIRDNWVHLVGFPASSEVGISVLDALGDPAYQDQVTVDAEGQVRVDFGTEGRPALETGMTVRAEVASPSISKEMVLFSASIDNVDIQARQISGYGPENSTGIVIFGRGTGVEQLGTTTDADGSWTLQVPPETSFIPGGQDLSVKFADVDGDVVHEKPVIPHLYVGLNIDYMYVSGYPQGDTVTFSISAGEEMIFSHQFQTDESGTFGFSTREFNLKLEPGMVVTAVGQIYNVERSVTLHALSLDQVDPEEDTASGSAEPLLNIIVNAYFDTLRYPFPLVADNEGNWQIDFDSIDITDVRSVTVESYNQAEDSVFSVLPDPPVIQASLINDWIEGYNFSSNGSVVISAYSGEESLFDPITRGTDPWGSFHLNSDETMVNLVPGNRITVQDSGMGITKELILENITLDDVDLDQDTTGGMAPANREVVASGGNQFVGREMKVTAGDDGHWTADFFMVDFDLTDDMNFNAKIHDEDGDFTMAELAPIPHIDAWLDSNSVSAYDWPIGAMVDLTISGPGIDGTFELSHSIESTSWNPGHGFYQFFLGDAVTLSPGQTISISDGNQTRGMTVMDLQSPTVDVVDSSISGVAAPGAVLWSNLCNEEGCANRDVVAGGDGSYEIDFDEQGDEPDEMETVHIHPGNHAGLNWSDGAGNHTSRDWRAWDPTIYANLNDKWVQGRDWPNGELLTLTVDGEVFGTAVMEQASWNPDDPNDIVAAFNNVSFEIGSELVLSNPDGTLSKTLIVSPIEVSEIDPLTDTISGTTEANGSIEVCANTLQGCAFRRLQADDQGNWSVNFAEPGSQEDEQGTVDIKPDSDGWVSIKDDDGDQTQIGWRLRVPRIIANAQQHWIQSREWALGTHLNLSIDGELVSSAVVAQAPWNLDDPNDILAIFDIDPSISMDLGSVLTVSNQEETIEKTLTLVALEITQIDALAATISGHTAANAWVEICVNTDEGCFIRNVQANPDGDWLADYSLENQNPRDIGVLDSIPLGANGWVCINDEDNDQMQIDWSLQNPYMDIWIDSNTIAAYHWPVGANLSLSIHAGETEVYHEDVVNGSDPQDPSQGFNLFVLPEAHPLEPGQTVTVTDQSTERSATVHFLDAPVVDVIHSQIRGTAPEGAYIWTCLFTDEGCVNRSTVVGEDEQYTFDFSAPGPNEDEEAFHNLEPGDAGGLNWGIDQGNNISRIWNAPNYPLHTIVMDQQVHGWEWPVGSEVTLTLYDPQTDAHAEVTRMVENVPGACGVPCFEMSEIPWTLAPGQTVTLSDGLVMKTVEVSPLEITEVDVVNDQIHGIADPGSTVAVDIFSEEDKHRLTEADNDGNWTVDFSQPGEKEDEQTPIDLVMSDFGRAIQLNPGRPNDDGTLQNWSAFPVRLDTDLFEENVLAGSVVASFVSLNPGVDLDLSYSLVDGDGSGNNSKFTVDEAGLHIIDSPNFEQQQIYNVRLRMTNVNDTAEWAEITYQLHVIDVNEAPNNLELDQAAVDENVAEGTLVGHFSASDPDQNQNIHFSLVSGEGDTDNEYFDIDNDQLNILVSPDYESKPFYQILVRATDDGTQNLYTEESFTILINNVNEGGSEIVLTAASINENVANGSTVGTLSVTDPDGSGNYEFSLVSGAGGVDNSSFTVTGNVLSINQSPDYETKNTYSIRVQATDQDEPENTLIQALVVSIHDVNEAPSDLHISTTSLDENIPAGSTVAEFTTDDPDEGQTHSYSLVDGEGDDDNSALEISGNHLVIKASPNFETKSTYHILVRTLENGENALGIDQAFTLTVNDLNEAPTNISLSASSINENVAGNTLVGSFTASDPDSSQSHSFTLVSGSGDADNNAFTITGSELRIKSAPDFEAKSSYSIRVQVTDNGDPNLSFTKTFNITVNDLNEAPSLPTLSSTHINENVAAGSTVGVLSASDPDRPEQSLSYALVAGEGATDNAAFTVTGNALAINASPDYETQSSYSIRVQVTDNGTPALSSVQTFTISINDLNERPANLALSNATIDENAPAGSRGIGTFSADDPDRPVQTLTYSLVSGEGSMDNSAFTITGNALSIKAAPDYETKSSYTIRVRVTDNGTPNLYSESAFTITITNVVEPPLVASFNKTGLQDTPINFTLNDFPDHFISVEVGGANALEKIKITALPEHGSLQLNQSDVALNWEIPAGNLNQLRYVPVANYSGSDVFSWMGANSGGYSIGTGQVFITVGFVARYGMQVNPAGDAKSVKVGSNAVYTLEITNTGNVSDTFTIGQEGSPRWTTTVTPAQSITLAPNGKASLLVSVAVPSGASGSDEVLEKITSQADASKTVTVHLITTAVSAPPAPTPVLLNVTPSSVNESALGTATLTLSGSNFTDPMTVRIGGVASPSVSRTNSGELVVRTPAGLQAGKHAVQVCNAASKCASLPEGLTILGNAPLITGVYPNQGYNDTQNAILIQGYNLSATTEFTLAGAAPDKQPTGASQSNGQVRAIIPAGLPAGTYDLKACNQGVCMTLTGAYTALDVIRNDFSAANEDLWTAPTTIREGNTILLGLNVHRSSGVGTAAVEVAFYHDDPTVPGNKISPATNPSTSAMTTGSVEAVTATWTPTGLSGAVKIYAVIDPDGLVTEASRANNVVSMTIQILPRQENDETAPLIQSLAINSGAVFSNQAQVQVAIQATDNANGSGIQSMNVVERIYNTSARQWVVAQESGWIDFQANLTYNLTNQAGVHYVQVWVADKAGNTSSMAQASINYQPQSTAILAGQVHIYRLELSAGDLKDIQLNSLSGDADLYIWDPDGNLVGYSIDTDPVSLKEFVAQVSGTYQVEVYGYTDATYRIDFEAEAAQSFRMAAVQDDDGKAPRSQPTVKTDNQPLMNIPTSSAPIIPEPESYNIYLPLINRN